MLSRDGTSTLWERGATDAERMSKAWRAGTKEFGQPCLAMCISRLTLYAFDAHNT